MNTRTNIDLCLFPATLAVFIFLLFGCTVRPDEKAVKDSISQYFEERKFRVVDIDIGDISTIPLSGKVYMGAEGYTVEIRSITLEVAEDSGAPSHYRKGQRLTFKKAAAQVRAGEEGRWLISHIFGISVI